MSTLAGPRQQSTQIALTELKIQPFTPYVTHITLLTEIF